MNGREVSGVRQSKPSPLSSIRIDIIAHHEETTAMGKHIFIASTLFIMLIRRLSELRTKCCAECLLNRALRFWTKLRETTGVRLRLKLLILSVESEEEAGLKSAICYR